MNGPVMGQDCGRFGTLCSAVSIERIPLQDGSFAINFARNLAEFTDSSFNTLSQTNNQAIHKIELEDIVISSFQVGINDADFDNSDNNEATQSNEQSINDITHDSQAANVGINNADLDDSDNNDVEQNNEQDIEAARVERLRAANIGVNNADLDDSDNNDVDQSNDQSIDDVKKGSSAENRAENSVSFDDSDSPPPDCQIC